MDQPAQGYLVIEDCLSPTECSEVLSNIESMEGAGTRCLLEETWCRSLARSLRARLAPTLPELAKLVAVQCTFFNKSPTSNWFVAFHQDRSIPVNVTSSGKEWPGMSIKEGMQFVHGTDDLLKRMMAIRLHVDDSTLDNGPLRVIPDSHRSGTFTTDEIDAIRNASPEVALTVRKGGIIAMRPLLLHASLRSRSSDPRRVLHFLFGPPTPPEGLAWRHGI